MCAILDANVVGQVFGQNRPPAAEHFLEWLSGPRGELVVGGRLHLELGVHGRFLRWFATAIKFRNARTVMDAKVDNRATELRREGICKSDDPHVLALALVSGARLLYSNDPDLIEDFKNPKIISDPRGKVYTTARDDNITRVHRRLLARRDLCRAARD